MSEKTSRKEDRPEELIRAEKLIDNAEVHEAHELLNNFERKEGLTLRDKVSYNLIRADLLFQQGRYQEALSLAEETYDLSLKLDNKLQSIDCLSSKAYSLTFLGKYEKALDIIEQGEELLRILSKDAHTEYVQRRGFITFLKGHIYGFKGEIDKALKLLEQSLIIREELGIKHEISQSLSTVGYYLYLHKGEVDRALKYAERSLSLAKESAKKYYIAIALNRLAGAFVFKGDLDRCIILFEQSLAIFKEFKNKRMMAMVLNNVGEKYRMKGDLNRGLECLEQSVALSKEVGNERITAIFHDFLIQILIDKGEIERARSYLQDLEQLVIKLKDKGISETYLLDKALLLKTSPRAHNRVKAIEIFNELLDDEHLNYELTTRALFNLCELYLFELRLINDVEVLDDINPLIVRLLDTAEKSQSYWILSETYLLQAKLSLLTFDIKRAQQFLTQAREIAENFGHTQLVTKITSEKADLLTKLDLWEKLKETGAPMNDRFELARLDERIIGLVYKNAGLTTQVTVEEVAISKEKKICLVCRGDVLRFSYICECGANYCGNCAQALTNLENTCWSFDAPIDFLKPVKPYRKEEGGHIKVQEKAKKK